MLTAIHPKLPMRNKKITKEFYLNKLGFSIFGSNDYDGYLMIEKERSEEHTSELQSRP